MQLSYGTPVLAADGEKIGNLKQLIVDPRHRIVTHFVVQQGLFFAHDRLISVDYIKDTDNDEIHLKAPSENLEDESEAFAGDEYVNLEDEEFLDRYGVGGAAWLRPSHEIGGAGLSSIVPPGIGPVPPEPDVWIPGGEVSLEVGTQIKTSDQVVIGHLEEFLTDEEDRITHVIIAEGPVFTESKKIPVAWIRKIGENEIELAVSLAVIEKI